MGIIPVKETIISYNIHFHWRLMILFSINFGHSLREQTILKLEQVLVKCWLLL